MTFIHRFFRTFCYHVLWPPRRVLVLMMCMWKGMWHVDSDILFMNLVVCVRHTPRGLFAFARAAGYRPRRFMVKAACRVLHRMPPLG